MPTPPELLARVPIFEDLSADALEGLAASTSTTSFVEGEIIFEVGDPGRALYVVTEGQVQVRHPNLDTHFQLAQLGPGDFFGEMALLNNAPRSATLRAAGDVQALVLDKIEFRRLLIERPDVALKILETLSVRVRSADELIQGLTDRAIRDPLTGLLNKRAFTDRLEEEIARTRRYGGSFSLIILDFDGFKDLNRRLGRDAGDRILTWAGRLLSEHTRGSDVPFRLDDDAFTILCPWTAHEFATVVAGRMATLISEAEPPVDAPVALSVSAGVATCPSDGQEALALYHRAETALRGEKA